MATHPRILAAHDAWANARVLAACAELDAAALAAPRASYFGSILGLVNHVLAVARAYRERLEGGRPPAHPEAALVRPTLDALGASIEREGAWLVEWLARTDDAALGRPIAEVSELEDPEHASLPARVYLASLFQHQADHRVELAAMLGEAGVVVPPLDLAHFLSEPRAPSRGRS